MPKQKVALVDEFHNLKAGGVYSVIEAMKKALEEENISVELLAMQKRGRLFNRIIIIPYLRELLFVPIWNYILIKRVHSKGYNSILFDISTSQAFVRKSNTKRVLQVHSVLDRQLMIINGLDLPVHIKLIARIIRPPIFWLERRSFHNADCLLVSRQVFRDYLVNNFGISLSKIKIVPQFINFDFQSSVENKKYDLLFVGRLSELKNWPLVEELAKIRPYKICAATPSGTLPEIYPANIHLFQNVPQNEIENLYHSSRIFIMPSFMETGPRVTLEAMACGLPVVASIEGSGDFYKDGEGGYIINSNSAEDYTQAIDKVLEDKSLRKRMGESNKRIVRKYSVEKMLPKYLEELI